MHARAHHIALKVRDLAKCAHFYAEILDLPVTARHQDQHGAARSTWFGLGGIILMLERCEGEKVAGQMPTAGWHLLALSIAPETRAVWREKLVQAGVTITGESAYSIYFCDPEGNRLALSHYPVPAPA